MIALIFYLNKRESLNIYFLHKKNEFFIFEIIKSEKCEMIRRSIRLASIHMCHSMDLDRECAPP